MKSDEGIFKILSKSSIIRNQYENVIRFPYQNTLNTKVKQIRNPQKEISGGFFNYLEYIYPEYNLCTCKLNQ